MSENLTLIEEANRARQLFGQALDNYDVATIRVAVALAQTEQGPPPPVIIPPVDPGDYGVDPQVPLDLYRYKPVDGAQPTFKPHGRIGEFEIRGDGKGGDVNEGTLLAPPHGTYMDECVVENVLLMDGERWASRNWGSPIRYGCHFSAITMRSIWDEHGGYWNFAGYGGNDGTEFVRPLDIPALTLTDFLIENIGSQALQFEQRDDVPHETIDPDQDFTPGGLVIVRDGYVRDVGQPSGGRPSFALSFFSTKNPLEVEDVEVNNADRDHRSRGLLLLEGERATGYERHGSINGLVLRSTDLDQPAVRIKGGWAGLSFTGCHFEPCGGQYWFDVDAEEPMIEFHDCTGHIPFKRGGKEVGYADKNGKL